MKRIPWPLALITGLAIGAGGGWWLAQKPEHAPHNPAPASATEQSQAAAAADSDIGPASLPAATGDIDAPPSKNFDAEVQFATRNPKRLRALLSRYVSETELDRKGALLAILSAVANDEVLRHGLEQASAADPDKRNDGLQLLAAFPPDQAQVRALLTKQLNEERDPAMQTKLLEVLQPIPMAREDAAPVVARLGELARSTDPAVRAASVQQLAQWDRSGASDTVQKALIDTDPQVRLAAIGGVGTANLRSPQIRDTLFSIAGDAKATTDERRSAILALETFDLDRTDFALLRQAAESLPDTGPAEHL